MPKDDRVLCPMAECPNCSKHFRWQEYFDGHPEEGQYFDCPVCGEKIVIARIETIVSLDKGKPSTERRQ